MIWLWIYLASIVPVMLGVAYVAAATGVNRRLAPHIAIMLGWGWPLLVPVFGLVWLVDLAAKAGVARAERSRRPQS